MKKIMLAAVLCALCANNVYADKIKFYDADSPPVEVILNKSGKNHASDPVLVIPKKGSKKQPTVESTLPQLDSNIALIYDEKSKKSLYHKNADLVAPIASITKLMTAMVVLDAKLPMAKVLSVETADMDTLKGTHSRLSVGMRFKRGELMKLALMSSENRAASALARTYPGGKKAAIAAMNAKARQLGMRNSYFRDPTGLNSDNVSTARDLVKMVAAARKYGTIRQYTTTASHDVSAKAGKELHFNNTNPLVRSDSWDIAISKTGFISEAGRCLVMEARINKRPVIIVLLDSQGKTARIDDAKRIKKWMEASVIQSRERV